MPVVLVVMGVSGTGKSSVGKNLAERLKCGFEDADDFHTHENKLKMSAGIALTDEDRIPWLARLAAKMDEYKGGSPSNIVLVFACSALKRLYREALRSKAGHSLIFIHLCGSFSTVERRLSERKGHFMAASLLRSQFELLEPPTSTPSVWKEDKAWPDPAIIVSVDLKNSAELAEDVVNYLYPNFNY
mmetsp:Transcript_12348/g.37658  ORF Transcript_12348/g.37658 Transcript_12348/m.37658 type:complete len:187 (+) Transcript_12348:93-653(+)|eukprot:CAMPEP_0198734178 /NCGR_PEP_ID=MMETSP1475-20131203/50861_1 /TAXON_ID= ORGANISM="Unidentified sp., Strain CCMP1999" /NCGR_SAMPLE_ID=MMETSP1475 /ASSEMBLY_ACC=CAM_ASM_001111 /LENGTH=186 /DNA_ID=CAMNT_0044497597 /DNA_START=103 /DNA_END=663 /DNA_ORIENTATION=-